MGPDWEHARQLKLLLVGAAVHPPRIGSTQTQSMSSHSKRRAESEEVAHKKK